MQKKDVIDAIRTEPAYFVQRGLKSLAEGCIELRRFAKSEVDVTVRRSEVDGHVYVETEAPALKITRDMVDELMRLGVRLWVQDQNHFISCRGNPFVKEEKIKP